MKILRDQIDYFNDQDLPLHEPEFLHLKKKLESRQITVDDVVQKIWDFQVAIPSWALGAGGTRFGRFSIGGEPGNLEEKIEDVGKIHALTGSAGAISLHIPWDTPRDVAALKALAAENQIRFDAVNSNTFQDQAGQALSYKFGSLSNTQANIRKQAIEHNINVIRHGQDLGSKSITVWLADGASFPGQVNFGKALQRTLEGLKEIYNHLPADWKMYIEYKPYEPNFYSTVIQDWGTSYLLASECGPKAYTLVDLGHHLPNTNIEQIVATLLVKEKLGGFHFNDSKYGDDDLTVGSIKPYQLFLIFNELVEGMDASNADQGQELAWMIDASHNLKDPLEDLIQSLEAILIAYAQALIVPGESLEKARDNHDVVMAQELLQDAFRTDVRPLVREARLKNGAAIDPLKVFRQLDIRKQLIKERGTNTIATGL